jgi:hypothetical protein
MYGGIERRGHGHGRLLNLISVLGDISNAADVCRAEPWRISDVTPLSAGRRRIPDFIIHHAHPLPALTVSLCIYSIPHK